MENDDRSYQTPEDDEATITPPPGDDPAAEDDESTISAPWMSRSIPDDSPDENEGSTVYPSPEEPEAEYDDEATIGAPWMRHTVPEGSPGKDDEDTVCPVPPADAAPEEEANTDAFGAGDRGEPSAAPSADTDAPKPAQPVYTPPQSPPAQPEGQAKKPRKKWLIPAIAAVALIALAAALIPVMGAQNKIKRYNKGADMIERGDYQGAYEVFKDLGNYEDSFTMAMYAQRGIGYQSALALMDNQEYTRAAETFDGLSGFKDSRELAAQCRSEIAYQRAVALFDAGDYTGAREAFTELGDFREAADYVTRCGSELASIAYNKAIQEGDYAKALEVLDSGEGTWENEDAMRTECSNHLLYLEAVEDLSNGLNYTAYKKFQSLGSFLDSAARAKDCKLSKPANGEVYRNSKYKTKYLTLKIKTPDDGNFNYLKIYAVGSSGKETLAVTVFIRANKTVSITLPKGTYSFKCAYGSGAWYGEKEMFGDDAVYERLTPNGSDSYTFSKKGTYTLTLRTATNGNTGSRSESRDSF